MTQGPRGAKGSGTTGRPERPAKSRTSPPRAASPARGSATPTRRTATPATPKAPADAPGPVRLQKLLARAGVASRRAAEELIREGHVSVDGRLVTEMGVTVDPAASVVKVDGKVVRLPSRHGYYLLNKPARVMCTLADPEGRTTVRDLIPAEIGRVYPVGRLDWDAEGVLLLTDDGDLANRLMHPRYGVERTYHVKVKGSPEPGELAKLERGVYLEDGRARAEAVRFLRKAKENSWITMTLREGRQHEVKRMCLAIGHPVQKINRVSYAGIAIGRLPIGHLRPLEPKEVAQLRRAAAGPHPA